MALVFAFVSVLAAPAVAQHEHAVQVTRLFKSGLDFMTQFDSGKEIVRLHDASVLPELEPYLKAEIVIFAAMRRSSLPRLATIAASIRSARS